MSGKRTPDPVRLTLDRDEIVTLIWAIDGMEESYAIDGGTSMIDAELDVREKLKKRLRDYDMKRWPSRGVSG